MAYFRLKETHPAHKAVEEVFKKMEELGVSFCVGSCGELLVTYQDSEFCLLDLDDSVPPNNHYPMNNLPVTMEYKLVFKKEDISE